MDPNSPKLGPPARQTSARIWLIVANIFFGLVIGVQVVALFSPVAPPVYGAGGDLLTLEAFLIYGAFYAIYGILATLPMLMVIGYQRSQLASLVDQIRDDLWLCGLDGRQLNGKMAAFFERNSWRAFIVPAVLTMILLGIMWSFFLMPGGLTGLRNSLAGLPPEAIKAVALSAESVEAQAAGDETSPQAENQSQPIPAGQFDGPNVVNMMAFAARSLTVITAAFLGAYFYIVNVMIRRWQRADLTTGVLWSINIRLAVALLVSLLLAAISGDIENPLLLAIGFLAGIVPDSVLRWLTQRARQTIGRKEEGEGGLFTPSDLQRRIDGLNFWQMNRLFEEGIESVQDLAMKEIPDLLIDTRFDTPQVLYWVDQALLSNQVGAKMPLFRNAFIITASDFIALSEANDGDLSPVLKALQGEGGSAEGKIITLELLENLVVVLKNGPNLPYIREYWTNTSSPQQRAEKLAELKSVY